MEQHIRRLTKRLGFLGYRSFEIKAIVKEATGGESLDLNNHHQCASAIRVLEKYATLGAQYQNCYSK